MGRLFGTDGVRGVVGVDLTEDLARELGRAAATVLVRHGQSKPLFVLGRDTRGSGPGLEAAISEGIRGAGGDVLLLGVFPTPGVAFLSNELGGAGVVISASHNPAEFNGIKLFSSSGYKLPDSLEDEVEAEMGEAADPATAAGREDPFPDAAERYLHHLTSSQGSLAGMRLVVDCANGAASWLAPEAYARLGARVTAIHDAPDGKNINDGCGATHVEVVAAATLEAGADAGVSHDGDADRALFADETGRDIDGDQVLAACAVDLNMRGKLARSTVVSTVMANIGFRRAMSDAGIKVITAKVGDRYVLEDMLASGAVLGGEQSGHVIFADRATTGDGLLTAIRFLSLAARNGVPVSEVARVMRRYPQVLVNVRVSDRDGLEAAAGVHEAVANAERILGDAGRILVRQSGTEPLVRVMVEAETEEDAALHAENIAAVVRTELGASAAAD